MATRRTSNIKNSFKSGGDVSGSSESIDKIVGAQEALSSVSTKVFNELKKGSKEYNESLKNVNTSLTNIKKKFQPIGDSGEKNFKRVETAADKVVDSVENLDDKLGSVSKSSLEMKNDFNSSLKGMKDELGKTIAGVIRLKREMNNSSPSQNGLSSGINTASGSVARFQIDATRSLSSVRQEIGKTISGIIKLNRQFASTNGASVNINHGGGSVGGNNSQLNSSIISLNQSIIKLTNDGGSRGGGSGVVRPSGGGGQRKIGSPSISGGDDAGLGRGALLVGLSGKIDNISSLGKAYAKTAVEIDDSYRSMVSSSKSYESVSSVFANVREQLSLTREEYRDFVGVTSTAVKSGVVSAEEMVLVANKIKRAFGELDPKKIQDYVSVLQELPNNNSFSFSVTASFDDKVSALMNLEKSGKLDLAANLGSAGAFGGLGNERDGAEALISLNKVEKNLADIKDSFIKPITEVNSNVITVFTAVGAVSTALLGIKNLIGDIGFSSKRIDKNTEEISRNTSGGSVGSGSSRGTGRGRRISNPKSKIPSFAENGVSGLKKASAAGLATFVSGLFIDQMKEGKAKTGLGALSSTVGGAATGASIGGVVGPLGAIAGGIAGGLAGVAKAIYEETKSPEQTGLSQEALNALRAISDKNSNEAADLQKLKGLIDGLDNRLKPLREIADVSNKLADLGLGKSGAASVADRVSIESANKLGKLVNSINNSNSSAEVKAVAQIQIQQALIAAVQDNIEALERNTQAKLNSSPGEKSSFEAFGSRIDVAKKFGLDVSGAKTVDTSESIRKALELRSNRSGAVTEAQDKFKKNVFSSLNLSGNEDISKIEDSIKSRDLQIEQISKRLDSVSPTIKEALGSGSFVKAASGRTKEEVKSEISDSTSQLGIVFKSLTEGGSGSQSKEFVNALNTAREGDISELKRFIDSSLSKVDKGGSDFKLLSTLFGNVSSDKVNVAALRAFKDLEGQVNKSIDESTSKVLDTDQSRQEVDKIDAAFSRISGIFESQIGQSNRSGTSADSISNFSNLQSSSKELLSGLQNESNKLKSIISSSSGEKRDIAVSNLKNVESQISSIASSMQGAIEKALIPLRSKGEIAASNLSVVSGKTEEFRQGRSNAPADIATVYAAIEKASALELEAVRAQAEMSIKAAMLAGDINKASEISAKLQAQEQEISIKKFSSQVSESAKVFEARMARVDIASSLVDESKKFAEEMGRPFSEIFELQKQEVDLQQKRADISREAYNNAVATNANAEETAKLQLQAKKDEFDLTRKQLGAQKSAYEKLVGFAFGQLKDTGARKFLDSDISLLGKENTRVKGANGIFHQGDAIPLGARAAILSNGGGGMEKAVEQLKTIADATKKTADNTGDIQRSNSSSISGSRSLRGHAGDILGKSVKRGGSGEFSLQANRVDLRRLSQVGENSYQAQKHLFGGSDSQSDFLATSHRRGSSSGIPREGLNNSGKSGDKLIDDERKAFETYESLRKAGDERANSVMPGGNGFGAPVIPDQTSIQNTLKGEITINLKMDGETLQSQLVNLANNPQFITTLEAGGFVRQQA